LASGAQHRSITFEHTAWKDIKAKAKKENKLIFVDAFTTWCGPCKQMARTVFTNDTAADYYNANFINAKIDMEKGEGLEIAKQYQVACYPNLLFIDGDGNLAHRVAGSMSVSMFVDLGKTAKDDSKNFSWYVKNYEAKKTDAKFVAAYAEALSGTCLQPDKELAQYFSLQNEKDLWSEDNWNMMKNYTNDLNSREFQFLLENKAKLSARYTDEAVNEKLAQVAKSSLRTTIRTLPFDEGKYELSKQQITKLNIPKGKQIIFESDLYLTKLKKDWKGYAELAMANVDTYYAKSKDELNSLAWDFYEHVDDKAALLKAEAWAKQSVELEASYPNLDTYAALLYKNGKKEEALATANKAIEYAKKENYAAEDYQPTSDLVTKIKAMK
jgi:thiol-disulfide isomerase/thioredoxin